MDWDVNDKLGAMGTLDFLGGQGSSLNGLPLFASSSLLDMPQFRVIDRLASPAVFTRVTV